MRPNGLAFSPDERRLYVSDTGVTHVPDGPRHIRAFDVGAGGALSGGEVFATCTEGIFDGFRFDADGRLWTSAGDGVHCYDPDGTLLGKVLRPRGRRQRRLRRAQAQPPVHLRDDLAVLGDAGRQRRHAPVA